MRNRKFLLSALIVALFLTGARAFSQNEFEFSSIEAFTSFGLFENALDAACRVTDAAPQPAFSKLGNDYFFGSFTNPFMYITGSHFTIPFVIGYYGGGKNPYSIFARALIETNASALLNGNTVDIPGSKPVGTTTYNFITQSTNSNYAFLQSYNANGGIQFLTRFGTMNIGLMLFARYDQNYLLDFSDWVDGNLTTTESHYYDTAGPLSVPDVELDYTKTSALSTNDSFLLTKVSMPMYIKVGGMGLEMKPTLGWANRNESASQTVTYTPPNGAGGSFGDVTLADSTTAVSNAVLTGASVIMSLPSLFKGDPSNLFRVSLNGSLNLYMPQDAVQTVTVQDVDYAGGGANFTHNGTNRNTVVTTTRGENSLYSASITAQNLLYFDLAEEATWAMGPEIEASMGFYPSVGTADNFFLYDTGSVEVISNDWNFDDDFEDAVDTIQTTTTTTENANDGGNWDIVTGIYLPTAIKFKPRGAPFAFVIGGNIGFLHRLSIISIATATTSTVTVTTDGTGAVTVPETTSTPVDSMMATSYFSRWNFSGSWHMNLTFNLPAGALIEIFWENYSFGVEGIIPLK